MPTRFFPVEHQGPWSVHAVETGPQADQLLRDVMASGMSVAVQGFALGAAMFTFSESKLIGDLAARGSLQAKDAADRNGYDYFQTLGLLRFFVTQGLFAEETGETFRLTPKGTAAMSPTSLAAISFYIGGYGHLMTQSRSLLEKKITYGKEVTRDSYHVAAGSKLNTASFMDMVPLAVLARKGARKVADLGCGAGQFLIEWVKGGADRSGVGVDLAPEAIEAARKSAQAQGVGDRLKFHVGDAFDNLALTKTLSEVDVIFSFAMEHEGLRDGEIAVLSHIDSLAEHFPGKRYLLGEPMLHMSAADGMFYWIHVLSLQGIPRDVSGWCSLLGKLKKAKLNEVFIPDHRQWCAYFDIELPSK
ncbi:MAG: LmbW [Myxococcales bacterium]|nr:LmbW [Myxococcales bacterium]